MLFVGFVWLWGLFSYGTGWWVFVLVWALLCCVLGWRFNSVVVYF